MKGSKKMFAWNANIMKCLKLRLSKTAADHDVLGVIWTIPLRWAKVLAEPAYLMSLKAYKTYDLQSSYDDSRISTYCAVLVELFCHIKKQPKYLCCWITDSLI